MPLTLIRYYEIWVTCAQTQPGHGNKRRVSFHMSDLPMLISVSQTKVTVVSGTSLSWAEVITPIGTSLTVFSLSPIPQSGIVIFPGC